MSKKNNEEFIPGMTGTQPETPTDVETETVTVDVEPTTPADAPAQEVKTEEKKEKFVKLKKFYNEGVTIKLPSPKSVAKAIGFVAAGAVAATIVIGKTLNGQEADEQLALEDYSGEGSNYDSGEALDCEYVGGDEEV